MKRWIKISGYIILILSLICWLAIAVIPFLGYSKGQVAAIITGLIIAGEITFYLGIAILGKSIYLAIKNKIMFWKSRKSDDVPTGDDSSIGDKT